MELTRKRFAAYIVLAAVLPIVLVSALDYALVNYHSDPAFHVNVFVTVEQAGGYCGQVEVGNVIVNGGRGHTRDALTDGVVVNAVKYVAIGTFTGTPDKTATALTTEYDREIGTIDKWVKDSLDQYGFNVTKKFTITDDATTLDCAGSCYDATVALYAIAKFDSTIFNNGDNCTIRWVFTHDYS